MHDYGVELDTELPTMMNIVEDDDSGCKPKGKRVPQKSKIFTSLFGKRCKVKTCI